MRTFSSPPRSQILVHGEQNEMARLKAALIREYEDNDQVHIEVHNPRNTEAVTLNFRGEKLAKVRRRRRRGLETRRGDKCRRVSLQVMGSLADKSSTQGQRVSGILVKRNFNYHILTPSDLSGARAQNNFQRGVKRSNVILSQHNRFDRLVWSFLIG